MKTIIITLIAILTCVFSFAQTVVTPEWVRNYSDRDSMTNIPSAIDANGDIYVTGSVRTISQGYNFATIKYNQAGDTLWVKNYNGTANLDDEAVAIALDANGNIIVIGKSKNLNNNYDFVTIKYNTSGNIVFTNTYNGTANNDDIPADVTTDNSANIYVTGYSKQSNNYDSYLTIKYNSNGLQQWTKLFNSTNNGNCRATSVLWKNNRLFVTGFAYQNTGTYSVTTQSYIASNGVTLWTSNYGIVSAIPSTPAKIVYFANNIYVSGTVGTNPNFDYSLIKYSSNNGAQQWATTYNAYGFNDFSTSMVLDNSGNIFVTGKSYNSNNLYEYHTLKYTSAGTLSWTNKYTTNLSDNAAMGTITNKIAIDPYNMLYICGSLKAGTTSDMLLYQLTASGNMVWDITYNGLANGIDAATDMVIDAQGRIFLTGQTQNGISKFDYTTVKLSQTFVYNPIDLNNEPRQSSFDYIKNKGQLVNTNNALIPEIKYYVPNTYPSLYFTPKRLSFVFAKVDTVQATLDTLHRIDMTFANCNQLATIFPIDTTAGFTNYYLPQCPQGITNVKGNERLFIPNIYPNIDLHYYSNNAGLKMYFVLKPGANPKDIAMLFEGQNNLQVNSNGELIITSSIGNTKFEQPHAYMVNYGQQIIPVNWQPTWQLQSSNKAVITTGIWNGPFPLVIMVDEGHTQQQQQNLNGSEWSTYLGNTNDNGETGVYDTKYSNGFFYVTGQVYGSTFPTANYLMLYQGSFDVFISKFDDNHVIKFSTYYGGNYQDIGFSIDVNQTNILVTGTCSGTNFPVYPSTNPNDGTFWQNNPNDDMMTCIIKLDLAGQREWVTAYGGMGTTDGNICKFDNNGNMYIAGRTNVAIGTECTGYNPPTNGDFPLKQNGPAYYQSTHSYLSIDYLDEGFIAKFDATNKIQWSTFFGGNMKDIIADMVINNGQIAVTGYSNSPTGNNYCSVPSNNGFPLCSSANEYFQSYKAGSFDGFISVFNSDGSLSWSTFIGGLSEDYLTDIAVNSLGNYYVCGVTISESDADHSVITPPSVTKKLRIYDPGNSDTQNDLNLGMGSSYSDYFLFKFNADFSLGWSSFIGGSGTEGILTEYLSRQMDIFIDNNNNLFVTGNTSSDDYPLKNLLGSVNNAHYASLNNDVILTGFNTGNKRFYSTYLGGDRGDEGKCLTGLNGKLYLTGNTFSTNFPTQTYTYPGAYNQTDLSPTHEDVFITLIPYTYIGGVDELKILENLYIYPNPCNDILHIALPKENCKWLITIHDISGKLIISTSASGSETAINCQNIKSGTYFITLKSDKQIAHGSFIIVR